MTFENFGRLTGATLLNEPAVFAFENLSLNPTKIKPGDLFIGNTPETIEQAIANGAFAIASEIQQTITDDEIAWFKIEGIEETLIKLLRFSLLDKPYRFFYADTITTFYIKQISEKKFITFLGDDHILAYQRIINVKDSTIFLSSDEIFLKQINPSYQSIHDMQKSAFHIIKASLFLTDFTFHSTRYHDIKIAPFLLPFLENAIHFLASLEISYKIDKCQYGKHFQPYFIDRNLILKPFGKSNRVILCVHTNVILDKVMAYLQTEASWAKSICILPENFPVSLCANIPTITYRDISEINRVKDFEYNFAIMVGNCDALQQHLDTLQPKEQNLLF